MIERDNDVTITRSLKIKQIQGDGIDYYDTI